jgi:hypothetical protein
MFFYKFCSEFMLFLSYIDSIILYYCLYPGSCDLVMDLWHVNKWKWEMLLLIYKTTRHHIPEDYTRMI